MNELILVCGLRLVGCVSLLATIFVFVLGAGMFLLSRQVVHDEPFRSAEGSKVR